MASAGASSRSKRNVMPRKTQMAATLTGLNHCAQLDRFPSSRERLSTSPYPPQTPSAIRHNRWRDVRMMAPPITKIQTMPKAPIHRLSSRLSKRSYMTHIRRHLQLLAEGNPPDRSGRQPWQNHCYAQNDVSRRYGERPRDRLLPIRRDRRGLHAHRVIGGTRCRRTPRAERVLLVSIPGVLQNVI